MKPKHALSLLLLTSVLAPLSAFANEPLTDCKDLGNDQQIVRTAGGQHIFLRDGESHYRLVFARDCSSVATASTIKITADDQPDRLCPTGTIVRTNNDVCRVQAVESIPAEEFAKRQKRARR